MHYVFEEPSVRQAVYASLDEGSNRIAARLVAKGMTQTQARVTARAYESELSAPSLGVSPIEQCEAYS
jgi:hypothetical protein